MSTPQGMDEADVLRMISMAGRDDMQQGEAPMGPEGMVPPGMQPPDVVPPVMQALQAQEPITEGETAMALLRAVRQAAEAGAASGDARVQKDAAAAAVGFAEALTKISTPIVDPRELETIRQQTQLEQARIMGDTQRDTARIQGEASAKAAKLREQKKVKVNRDQSGNATSYETE